MASGDSLFTWGVQSNEPPASNFATIDSRNGHLVLDFDATTQEGAVFSGIMPQHYSGGNIIVLLHSALSSATSGTQGYVVAFERIGDSQQDIDSDGFASDQTITAVTVPGTSGYVDILSVTVTAGSATDNITAGEKFRLRVRRDVANDSASGDTELTGIEIREA